MTRTNILYPLARSETGRAAHIREALKGHSYEMLRVFCAHGGAAGAETAVAFCPQTAL